MLSRLNDALQSAADVVCIWVNKTNNSQYISIFPKENHKNLFPSLVFSVGATTNSFTKLRIPLETH